MKSQRRIIRRQWRFCVMSRMENLWISLCVNLPGYYFKPNLRQNNHYFSFIIIGLFSVHKADLRFYTTSAMWI
ncbi:uncharacterized protein EpC_00240 [Erwinia pyrifoliae Ep1/96]|nr:uncharacterized protein EpC_00240 [Erwinia pyrifoliae Ep1/96]